ncbi:rod shape-determining protein MreD [Oceanobacillus halotolerans]|uniref:rod shape-determining protein MreD n=1 Tax=Oceanobacillus halotolerans TaxID=2663380 RepID=UPI0013DA0346|nr:rod shape-determining protein MreD [Oceanobacillus halotolerans]
MKRLIIPAILFLLLILEGVAFELLPANLVTGNSVIIPHWVLIFLVFVAIFYDRANTYFCVLYGLIFGLLIDVVYTSVLGVYMFTYSITIYMTHGLKKIFHANFYVTILLGTLSIAVAEGIINIIFFVVGISDIPIKEYTIYRLLPTLLANFIFMVILYPIFAKRLLAWQRELLHMGESV